MDMRCPDLYQVSKLTNSFICANGVFLFCLHSICPCIHLDSFQIIWQNNFFPLNLADALHPPKLLYHSLPQIGERKYKERFMTWDKDQERSLPKYHHKQNTDSAWGYKLSLFLIKSEQDIEK